MALSTRSSNVLGSRLGNRENLDAGKGMAGKPRLTSSQARTALGNISNRTNHVQSANEQTKRATLQREAKKTLSKSNAVTSLQEAADKENARVKKVEKVEMREEKVHSPAPMDTSANSQGDHAFSKQLLNVNDIDKDDKENPQLVAEYVNDIYDYMRELEDRFATREKYLEGQEINGRMRGILIDWLVQVHLRFHLLQETLYLTEAIIDRFLQEHSVTRSKLQLVGVTCMLIASKYEEMYAPEIGDFVYITDNAYSKSDIRKMECLILSTLGFNLGRPLPLHFLRRNSKAGEVDATTHTLAKYLMELTIVEYDMVHIHPSKIAAAALCFAMQALEVDSWSDTLTHYSKYSEEELRPIIQKMANLVLKAGSGKLTAIYTKYQSSKFMRISTYPQLKSQLVQDIAKGRH